MHGQLVPVCQDSEQLLQGLVTAGSSLGKDLEKVFPFSQFIFVFSCPFVLSSEAPGFYAVDVSLLCWRRLGICWNLGNKDPSGAMAFGTHFCA